MLNRNATLDVKDKNVVLFYLPYREFVTGGILSIFFLLDKTIFLRPQTVVLPVVMSPFQRYFRTSWFKSPFFIYNLIHIYGKLNQASKIVIHVPECQFEDFFMRIRKYGFEEITRKATINILNQNAQSMPDDNVFYHNKPLCGKLTMTLAFAVNQNKNYPFLDVPLMTMSAWFYGDIEKYSDFDRKENICIVSPDDHPLKRAILKQLEGFGCKCIEIRNMPFKKYRSLCTRAKWAVSFGEGYDGYCMGTLKDGGIGFAVDQSDFRPYYIDVQNLPLNIFHSYQNMLDHIVDRMKYFEQNPQVRKQTIDFFRENAQKLNSPELVMENLENYYQAINL